MSSNNDVSRDGFVDVPGGKVWYKIVGSGPGTPLVTLHGGPGSTHHGMTSLEALSDQRPVVFYDQLGCGASDRPDDESLWRTERFVEEMHQIRQALHLDEMHILGHSWGTMLAMNYYLAHPQGIASMVMSSPCISIARWVEDCSAYRKQLPAEVQAVLDRHEAAGTIDSKEYDEASKEFDKRHVNRLDPQPKALLKGRVQRDCALLGVKWRKCPICTGMGNTI